MWTNYQEQIFISNNLKPGTEKTVIFKKEKKNLTKENFLYRIHNLS